MLEALSVSNLKDRNSVEDRLLELYSESEQKEKLIALEKKFKQEDEMNGKLVVKDIAIDSDDELPF